MIGGLSVVCTSGLGASIVTSINGDNQFKFWFTYFILVFGKYRPYFQYVAHADIRMDSCCHPSYRDQLPQQGTGAVQYRYGNADLLCSLHRLQ